MSSEAMNESLRQEKEGQEGRLRALELQVTQLKDSAAEAEAAAKKAKSLVVRDAGAPLVRLPPLLRCRLLAAGVSPACRVRDDCWRGGFLAHRAA